MTTVSNGAGDERRPRQAVAGGGDCVICARETPGGPALEVIQVVEGLAHHRDREQVDIPILMVVRNPGDTAVAMRVVHRAFVKASLKRFGFRAENPSAKEGWEDRDLYKKRLMNVLRGLYAGRLWENPDQSGTALFRRRVNCLGSQQETEMLSLDGPGRCFSDKDELDPTPAFPQGQTPSYCSYLLPAVAAHRAELFVLWLTLEGPSYQRLVGKDGMFTVDSHTRLLRQIKAFDLDMASDSGKDFYRQHVEPGQSIIAPAAYDIVIFQDDLGDSIAVEAGSICILRVQPEDEHLAEQALWFYGQPEEFYLVLRYESAPTLKPATNGFVVGKRGALV